MKVKILTASLLFVLSSVSQAASLLGDTVDTRWQYSGYDQSESYVVGAGIEDSTWITNAYSLDIGINTISINSNSAVEQAATTKWTFSSLDLGAPITGFSLSTNWSNMNDSWISFGSNWLVIDFLTSSSMSLSTDYLDITLETGVSAAPVPAAAFLFAPALLGFMGLRRKAKQA